MKTFLMSVCNQDWRTDNTPVLTVVPVIEQLIAAFGKHWNIDDNVVLVRQHRVEQDGRPYTIFFTCPAGDETTQHPQELDHPYGYPWVKVTDVSWAHGVNQHLDKDIHRDFMVHFHEGMLLTESRVYRFQELYEAVFQFTRYLLEKEVSVEVTDLFVP